MTGTQTEQGYMDFYRQNGYFPKYYCVWDRYELHGNDVIPTLTTKCGDITSRGIICICDI